MTDITDMTELTVDMPNEQSTMAMGASLAQICPSPLRIYLSGELGAGKTTLSRGFLRALGHAGNVKSPTYTLVEPYEFDNVMVFHFDLYRIADPEELAYMGFDDYLMTPAILLVEWADRGGDWLPPPDLLVHLSPLGEGRQLRLMPQSAQGLMVCRQLRKGL
ncbi:MAG: tRNA (adenosine(37)-N6)-threonylcarbamoyltransferase complex ATPase subunit type 1 TsaE [Luminiphilus sp.]|jgi:tRNA threonylcarbamoyladenosine biosynthesis protein TsaE|nr:tRNA (adenosine(37)-N6)-threonylcarbamoyltransferase complex ATPase subunit type 1 TsaE [Luminiphilus sp.]MDG1459947.1 tRNA (adenosine(37)-N6)-threonylcarbamoyltransferase complex ATPase subunit type 1 TsaE [Luminiphilus sp.]